MAEMCIWFLVGVSMSKRRSVAEHNYWPGYVDALTNIALNLLFLVAIFVIGVGALGMIASKKSASSNDGSAPQRGVEVVKSVIRQIIIRAPEVGGGAGRSKVELELVEHDSKSRVVKLGFGDGAFLLEGEQQSEISKRLMPELSADALKIEITTRISADDALLVRGAMTRLLSVRNMLLRSGVPSDRIEVRIVPDEGGGQIGQNIFLKITKE